MSDLSRKSIRELAAELRNYPTFSERLLWSRLRKRQLEGLRFVRQKPFVHQQYYHARYFYIADFYCPEIKLVIELDGEIHKDQKDYDRQRDMVLTKLGLNVLRIRNKELEDMEKVLQQILAYRR